MIRNGRRKLRQHCADVLRDLALPDAFDVSMLCARLSARRGRPIKRLAVPGLSDVCGLWIATGSTDLIVYERNTSAPHQNHIVLHEIGHILCDHFAIEVSPAEHAKMLLPSLDPDMIRRVLGRAGYSSTEEREAEYLASLLGQRTRQSRQDESAAGRLRAALANDHG